jgi:hypothetical protein
MMNKMMKITMGAAAFALVAGNAHAQSSQYGGVEDFYQANLEVDNGQYAGRVVNPGYWLIDSSQWADVDSRWTGGGYVRLGISNWQSQNIYGGGIPQKELALAYARLIGADVVIYTTVPASNGYGWTGHQVTFYARAHAQQQVQQDATRPSNAQASLLMNRLQDRLGKPHVKGGVWYDAATDTYNWIGPKFGRRMSMPASQFLDEVTHYS